MNTNNKRTFFNNLFFKLNKLIATFVVIAVVLSCGGSNLTTPDTPPVGDLDITMSASSVSTNELTLTLGGDYDYDYFILLQGEKGASKKGIASNIAGTNVTGDPLTDVSYTATNLAPNTEYEFSLQACKGGTCSEETVDTTVVTKPMEPGDFVFVRAENTSTSLSFTWKAPTLGGADHYALYRGDVAVAENIMDTKQVASGLESGTEYTFDLVACNKNNLCSTTNEKTFTTPPDVVTGLATKGDPGSTDITISWTEPQATTSYVVSKQKDGGTTFEEVANSPNAGDSEFKIENLEPETSYTFSLRACNVAGCSEPATVEGRTVEVKNPPANAPEDLRHTRVSSTAVELEWGVVEEATYYPVLYKTGSGPEVSNSVANASKFATTVALTPNTEYTFSVKACNEKGCFDQASSTNITTAPVTPENFSSEAVTSTNVDLKWDMVTGAKSYIVSRDGNDIATNTGTTHTAGGLDAGTEYAFSVKACNDFGCSLEATVDATTTPEAPKNFTNETLTSTTVDLKWDAVTGADFYIVSWNGNDIAPNTGTTYRATGLTANTPYTFSVKACNGSGCSDNADLTLTTAPVAPENFISEVVTSTNVDLKWDTVTGANSYIVYRDGSAIVTNTGTTYLATGLTANTPYTFSVKACNDFGCSDNADLTTTTAPDISGSLSYETVTSTTVDLKWDVVTGANSYVVYRDGDAIATNTETTYTASGLNAGTEYTFSMRACNSFGCSDNTDLTLTTAPGSPQNFSSEAVTSTTVSLKWDVVDGANSYIVYRDGDAIATNSVTPLVTTYTATGLNALTEYTFSVKACNDFGCSENSSDLTSTTLVGSPQNLATNNTTVSSIDLTWNAVTGADYYIVYTNAASSLVPVATNGGDNPATTHMARDLIDETEYTFTVRACNGQGCSDPASITASTLAFPEFYTISYPKMASEASATSMPVIVRGKNCNLEALTTEGKVTYGIDFLNTGGLQGQLLAIDSTTGVVNNKNRISSPGVYQVEVTVAENTGCNTNVLVYNTYTPSSKGSLISHIFPYDSATMQGNTGNYNYIDTSKITDMSGLFQDKSAFNGDITDWDTSQVINMDNMFNGASAFSQDLSGWDVSKVTARADVFTGSAMAGDEAKWPEAWRTPSQ